MRRRGNSPMAVHVSCQPFVYWLVSAGKFCAAPQLNQALLVLRHRVVPWGLVSVHGSAQYWLGCLQQEILVQ